MSNNPMKDLMDNLERINPDGDGLTSEQVRGDLPTRLALARVKVYYRASKGNPATRRAGIIGVGLITYAEHRLATFDRRVEALA